MPQLTKEHEILKKDVGVWDATVKLWPGPGTEPLTSKATETNELIGNGLWVVSRFKGDIAGMPFTGAGTFGYDPMEKKYVGTWVDSMSPYLMLSKGDYDAETNTFTAIAEGRDPVTGEKTQSKQVGRYLDDDTRVFEIHSQGPDGEYFKMLEIAYKRRAE